MPRTTHSALGNRIPRAAALVTMSALLLTACGSSDSSIDGPDGYKNSNLSTEEKALLGSGDPVTVTVDEETGEILTVTAK